MSLNEISLVIQNGRSSNMKRAAEVAIFDDKKPFCEMKSLGEQSGRATPPPPMGSNDVLRVQPVQREM